MYTYIYGGIFLIGLILGFFALKQFHRTCKIISVGIKTDAKIFDFETVSDSVGDTFTPLFEYFNSSGIRKEYSGEIGHAQPSMQIGDTVQIIYNEENEHDVKVVSYWGLFRWTILLFVFAAPFMIIGGGYLLYILW